MVVPHRVGLVGQKGRSMVRTVAVGALLLGLAAGLSGCGGERSASGPVTVTVTSTVVVDDSGQSWPMPDEIGKNLQRAQDDLQALTGDPMFVSSSEDLTGKGRQQIMDRHWRVCSSTPPPGATFTSRTNVVFGVVKESEECP